MNNITFDDDDEFGGAINSIEKIYKRRPAIVADDDEFGGAINTLKKIYKRKPTTPTSATPATKKDDTVTKAPLFAPRAKNNTFLIDRKTMFSFENATSKTGYHLPLVIDTEFTDKNKKTLLGQSTRLGLTTQICGIHQDATPRIYAHNDAANAGRQIHNDLNPRKKVTLFPLIQTDFHPLDYMISEGKEIDLQPCQSYETRKFEDCVITLYGHFLLAEILLISSKSVRERILELLGNKIGERIEMGRRLRCVNPIDGTELDYVNLNHIVTIDGKEFNLCLRLIDTAAIHGVASYKAFCTSVGIALQHKDNFSKDEKEDMLKQAIEKWLEFENYALGDLEVYEALEAYNEKWKEIYKLLGLEEYYQEPKLTIGGSVKDIFVAALAHKLEVSNEDNWKTTLTEEIVQKYIQPTSANDLRQSPTWTRALLAKVEGGRCRNNRPTITRIIAEILDIDISGCYGEGQRNQDYFIGIPEIWEYKATATNNDYVSLRNWLKAYDVPVEALIKGDWNDWGELISGAWIARISTKEPLKYAQDFFASWFTEGGHGVNLMTKFIKSINTDENLESSFQEDFDEEYGSLKIFNNEMHNSLLQHDGLEWIFAIATPRQRNEMLDKIVILASAVYPKSQQIDPDNKLKFSDKLIQLSNTYKNWKGVNITNRIKVDGRPVFRLDFDECYAWFPINLGDLLINNLLIQRKIAQKVYGKKSPLDVLLKLIINTLYGDMVSKFFVTSNPVVGNNITARARAMAWYMEKGFHGIPSITDGCPFEMNGVLIPNIEIINGECVNQHRKDSKLNRRKIKKSSLGGNPIKIDWSKTYTTTNENTGKIEVKHIPHIVVKGIELTPTIHGEEGKQYVVNPGIAWLDKTAFEHLRSLFPKVSVLHKRSDAITIEKDENGEYKPNFIERIGQFSFETKDVYQTASFHGSANYSFRNPNETIVKARGYNTSHKHLSIDANIIKYEDNTLDATNVKQTERYNSKNNPAKDFLLQLLEHPESISRQTVAIKKQILKPSEYKENKGKYDYLGLTPGDNIKKCFLMQEFSLSQFTFKTYKQYMMWKKCIEKGKLKNKQSLESYFLNDDGTLNFQSMIEKIDEMIANDVEDPLKELDKHRNRQRTMKRNNTKKQGKEQPKVLSIEHPSLKMWEFTRESLGEISEEISEE